MQSGFFRNLGLSSNRKEVIDNILAIKKFFKRKSWPVVYTTITHKSDASTVGIETRSPWNTEGSSDAEIIDELTPDPDDLVINKLRFSAFFKTSLKGFVEKNNVTRIYIAGLTAGMCVMNTSLDCYNHDIHSMVVTDAILDDSESNLAFFTNYFTGKGIGIKTCDLIKCD